MDELDLGSTIKGFIPGQKVLNRYKLARILGRGGMGVVWLARDEELERDVALKFLPEVVAMDKDAVKELKRETRRSLELTHSHIIRIYDFLQDARAAAISMEYVDGDTLASRRSDLPRGFYEPAEIVPWIGQLCAALDYAHAKAQIVHRDLKPANLMIDARGDLKIADFGIAASVSDSVSRISAQGGSSGTPVYMSPQQMMGERPAVTDDIYSLGATLFDLLTGKPPFYSGNIIAQVQSKVPPSLDARRKELGGEGSPLPEIWEEVIASCLAKDAAARPQSAGEVAERLGLAASGNTQRPTSNAERSNSKTEPRVERVAAPRAPTQSKSGTQKSKRPALVGLAAGVLLLGGLGWYFGLHEPEQQRLAAERAAAEKGAADRKAEEQRRAAEKAAAEQAERERQASEARAKEEARRVAEEKARQEEAARIKAEQERQEREKIEALDKQRARLLADLLAKVQAARRDWAFEGFDRLEQEIQQQAQELDEARRTTLTTVLTETGRDLSALGKRVEMAKVNARNAWLELKRMAELLRARAQGGAPVPDDLRRQFLALGADVAKALRYRDAQSGREYPIATSGLSAPALAASNRDPALLVVYGGAGMLLSLNNEPAQEVVGVWEDLLPGVQRLRVERTGFVPNESVVGARAGELTSLYDIAGTVRWQPLVDPKMEFLARVQGAEWRGKMSVLDPVGVKVNSADDIVLILYASLGSSNFPVPIREIRLDPVGGVIHGKLSRRLLAEWKEGAGVRLRLTPDNQLEVDIDGRKKPLLLTR